jgi:hypothetical protein
VLARGGATPQRAGWPVARPVSSSRTVRPPSQTSPQPGALAETGPAAAEVGVATYRARSVVLSVACDGIFNADAHTVGVIHEAGHEAAVAWDIASSGKCLHYRKVFGSPCRLIIQSSRPCASHRSAATPSHPSGCPPSERPLEHAFDVAGLGFRPAESPSATSNP